MAYKSSRKSSRCSSRDIAPVRKIELQVSEPAAVYTSGRVLAKTGFSFNLQSEESRRAEEEREKKEVLQR
jgi:hypothetical protein